jgi:hypothetical protein
VNTTAEKTRVVRFGTEKNGQLTLFSMLVWVGRRKSFSQGAHSCEEPSLEAFGGIRSRRIPHSALARLSAATGATFDGISRYRYYFNALLSVAAD